MRASFLSSPKLANFAIDNYWWPFPVAVAAVVVVVVAGQLLKLINRNNFNDLWRKRKWKQSNLTTQVKNKVARCDKKSEIDLDCYSHYCKLVRMSIGLTFCVTTNVYARCSNAKFSLAFCLRYFLDHTLTHLLTRPNYRDRIWTIVS